jgi:hypothetical protein
MSDPTEPNTPSTPATPPVTPTPPSAAAASEPARTASAPAPNLPVPIQPGERVLLLRRKHWMYLWPTVALTAAIALIPTFAFLWLLDAIGVEGKVATIIVIVYLLFFVMRLALIWYRYHHDYWVVTNQRVIDVKRNHPLNMQISTADLVNIQDMTIDRNGLLKTMLDYGDVICQTAGTDADFKIVGVKDPRAVQALVDRERDRERLRVRG